ncbi:MAG: hypothetical protein E6J34_24210 [Chloroflexi bacterium]|nr:MAG: hypothetical protein E6J34_24210 [Chloroflexota bacterium]
MASSSCSLACTSPDCFLSHCSGGRSASPFIRHVPVIRPHTNPHSDVLPCCWLKRPQIPKINCTSERRLVSLLIGIIFAIGWTPCIGLILGPILSLAAASATLKQGVLLLLAYSVGMGLPFLLLGLGLNEVSRLLRWLKPYLRWIEVGTGVLMILVGILIFLNMLTLLNRFVSPGFGLH